MALDFVVRFSFLWNTRTLRQSLSGMALSHFVVLLCTIRTLVIQPSRFCTLYGTLPLVVIQN
jgi:hypothetical protein